MVGAAVTAAAIAAALHAAGLYAIGRANPQAVSRRTGGASAFYKGPARKFKKGEDRKSGIYNARAGLYAPANSRELKYHDFTKILTIIASNGLVLQDSCNLVPQGTGAEQRVGRKLIIKKLQLRFHVELQPTAINTGALMRIMIVLDTQANGTAPTFAQIVQGGVWNGFNNLATKNRFLIIRDMWISFNYTAGAGDGTTNDFPAHHKLLRVNKRCQIPVEISGTGTPTISNIESNNLVIITGISNTSGYKVGYRGRIRYYD